jgi:hypothetical protein
VTSKGAAARLPHSRSDLSQAAPRYWRTLAIVNAQRGTMLPGPVAGMGHDTRGPKRVQSTLPVGSAKLTNLVADLNAFPEHSEQARKPPRNRYEQDHAMPVLRRTRTIHADERS